MIEQVSSCIATQTTRSIYEANGQVKTPVKLSLCPNHTTWHTVIIHEEDTHTIGSPHTDTAQFYRVRNTHYFNLCYYDWCSPRMHKGMRNSHGVAPQDRHGSCIDQFSPRLERLLVTQSLTITHAVWKQWDTPCHSRPAEPPSCGMLLVKVLHCTCSFTTLLYTDMWCAFNLTATQHLTGDILTIQTLLSSKNSCI